MGKNGKFFKQDIKRFNLTELIYNLRVVRNSVTLGGISVTSRCNPVTLPDAWGIQ